MQCRHRPFLRQLVRAGVLAALLCTQALAGAESTAAAATPAVPEPARLAPDWWNYFVVADDAQGTVLAERFAQFTPAVAAAVAAAGDAQQRAELEQLEASIDSHFERYLRVLRMPPATPPIPPPLQAGYTLDRVLELGRERDQLQRTVDLEAQELGLLEQTHAAAEDQLSARKLRYRDLDANAPERVAVGLRVIRDRLRKEALARELAWRRSQLAALRSELSQRGDELAAASERLTATPADMAAWRRAEEAAQQQGQAAAARLMQLQLSGGITLATNSSERAAERLHDARLLDRRADVALAATREANARLAQRLLARVIDKDAGAVEEDRALLRAQQAILDAQEALRARLQSRAGRLRRAIAVEGEAEDAAVAAVQAKARAELEAVEAALQELGPALAGGLQIAGMLDQRLREREGGLGRSMRMLGDAGGELWTRARAVLHIALFEINDSPVTTLDLLRLAVIVTAALWLSSVLRRGLKRIGRRNQAFNPASLYVVGRVLHYLLLLFGLVVGLGSIGVDLTKFTLFASALGIGVGFGLQTLISNFVAGLIILFEKSLNVGDFVELASGTTGEVREINMRATRITTNDNADVLVPNAELVSSKVTNWTLRDSYRCIHVPFSVAPGADKEAVRTAALEAARKVEHTLSSVPSRVPQVWLTAFSKASLDFELAVWLVAAAVKRPRAVQAAYCWAIQSELVARGIDLQGAAPATPAPVPKPTQADDAGSGSQGPA